MIIMESGPEKVFPPYIVLANYYCFNILCCKIIDNKPTVYMFKYAVLYNNIYS